MARAMQAAGMAKPTAQLMFSCSAQRAAGQGAGVLSADGNAQAQENTRAYGSTSRTTLSKPLGCMPKHGEPHAA